MRFFCPLPLLAGHDVLLPEDVSHHLLRVLRVDVGCSLTLFNGEGGEYVGELIAATKKVAHVRLHHYNDVSRESSLHTHLGQVMSKGDRMDYAIQKATELGVSEITPLFSERCEIRLRGEDRADKKVSHWQRVAISACEQCGRTRPPRINEPKSLNDWTSQVQASLKVVMAPSASAGLSATSTDSVALLIGPEGGLSAEEIAGAQTQGFYAWQLGPRVFRTETAPVAALALLQARFGDL